MLWAVAFGWAGAPLPLPSYRDVVADAERTLAARAVEASCPWDRLGQVHVCDPVAADAVVDRIDRWQAVVFADAELTYWAALVRRYQGRPEKALARYRASLALDATDEAAWYDMGELLLAGGRLDEAERAFEKVAELRPEGDKSWTGPWRLAEVAAERHDAAAMDRHLREALRRGFTFQTVKGLPNWRRYAADPALADTLRKLLTVYATPDIAPTLRP
jgi:tetratricopeptide (TPR) repeat protein